MSFETQEQAQMHCDKVLDILDPDCDGHWHGRVWDNLGWHCAWQWGSVSLYYSDHGDDYDVLIGAPGGWGGRADLSCTDNEDCCKDPKEAIRKACDVALEVFEKEWKPIQLSVEEIRSSVEK